MPLNETDAKIGKKIFEIRKENGLVQADMAKILTVSTQQFQKYEKGLNRISAAHLYKLSKGLNVPLDRFFEYLEK